MFGTATAPLRTADLLGGDTACCRLLDLLDCGIAVYDAQGRLVFCNRDFRALHAPIAHLLVAGLRFEDLLAQAAGCGVGAAGGRT